MIVKLGFVYVLEQRLAVTQEFKCFLTKKVLLFITKYHCRKSVLQTYWQRFAAQHKAVIMSLILRPYFNLHWVLIYEKSGGDMPFKIKLRTNRI